MAPKMSLRLQEKVSSIFKLQLDVLLEVQVLEIPKDRLLVLSEEARNPWAHRTSRITFATYI